MNRILTLLLAIAFNISAFSQSTTTKTCEQRAVKLRESIGTISAGLIYNTYLALGAISDAYVYKGYSVEKINMLFDEQKAFLARIDGAVSKLVTDQSLTDPDDVHYVQDISSILKGLQKQMEYFQDYLKDKTAARTTTYDNQRKKNWDKIARLMDIKN